MMPRETHSWSSTMHLQCSDCGHQNHHMRSKAGVATFNVEKFLHTDVSPESCLSYCLVELKGQVRKLDFGNTMSFRSTLAPAQ